MFRTWEDFYQSDVQSLYALLVVPAVFLYSWLLAHRSVGSGIEPRARSFMNAYAPLFTLETMLDPFVTGPLLRWFQVGEPVSTYCMILFVLLGDLRVYLLIFFLIAPERGIARAVGRAAAWTLIVPIFAWTATYALESHWGKLPSQAIWIVYELGFFVITLFLALRLVPSSLGLGRFNVHFYLKSIVRYVGTYYALWVAADLLIVGGGLDLGWGLRVIPNQLYYSFWIPFAYFAFFSRRYAPSRRSTHASR